MNLDFDPPSGAIRDVTVVLFNGPPHSGKDEAGKCLLSLTRNSSILKFAGTLKRSTHIDFGLPDDLPDDAFESCKDQPHPAFFGLTPRNAYIQKSQERQKPFLGNEIYGRTALRRLWRLYLAGKRVFFCTDSGFADEVQPLFRAIPREDFLLVRLFSESRGCSFKIDSRTHIELPGVHTYNVDNNGSIDEFHNTILALVSPFIGFRTVFNTDGSMIRCHFARNYTEKMTQL